MVWREKVLGVNIRKTKFMISGHGLVLLRESVCRTGVWTNSIQCSQCRLETQNVLWYQRQTHCEQDYVCPRCCDLTRPIDGRPATQVELGST